MRTIFFLLAVGIGLFAMPTQGQETQSGGRVNAQTILAKLDETLDLGNGLVKGNLILIRRSGNSDSWKVNLFRQKGRLLYIFDRKGRGLENKLLTLDEGDKIYLYNSISQKLFRKTEEEKYETFQNTGFSYIDLSGYLYQANYDPIMNGEMKQGEEDCWRVSLKPILTYEYKKLVLLVRKENLEPIRIDFHDKEGTLLKTMNLKYTETRHKTTQGVGSKRIASRWEMLDLRSGTIGVWEITELDETVIPDESLFQMENLGK